MFKRSIQASLDVQRLGARCAGRRRHVADGALGLRHVLDDLRVRRTDFGHRALAGEDEASVVRRQRRLGLAEILEERLVRGAVLASTGSTSVPSSEVFVARNTPFRSSTEICDALTLGFATTLKSAAAAAGEFTA